MRSLKTIYLIKDLTKNQHEHDLIITGNARNQIVMRII